MKEGKQEKGQRVIIRNLMIVTLTIVIGIILITIFPDKRVIIVKTAKAYFIEMIMILPAVMIIIGLFSVWVSKEKVKKYLGNASGIKGISLAILFGALPTGPLYIAFPIARELIEKGASISNIVIFLSAWACIKIPQEMVELQFLGLKFMTARLFLTIVFVVIMGLLIERIIGWWDKKGDKSLGGENASF